MQTGGELDDAGLVEDGEEGNGHVGQGMRPRVSQTSL